MIGTSIAANYFRGVEAVGGKIEFNENYLVFKSHAINIQTGEQVIEYSKIVDIETRNTLGIVPNGILIRTSDGAEHKFVVNNRKNVIQFIKSKMTSGIS